MGKVGYYTLDLRHTVVSLVAFMQVSGLELNNASMHMSIFDCVYPQLLGDMMKVYFVLDGRAWHTIYVWSNERPQSRNCDLGGLRGSRGGDISHATVHEFRYTHARGIICTTYIYVCHYIAHIHKIRHSTLRNLVYPRKTFRRGGRRRRTSGDLL